MNIFTEHTQRQGVTYIEHWLFAMSIATRLLNSVVAFALHAIFPFIDIKKKFDLEATARFIHEKNTWIEGMKHRQHDRVFDTSVQQNNLLAALPGDIARIVTFKNGQYLIKRFKINK